MKGIHDLRLGRQFKTGALIVGEAFVSFNGIAVTLAQARLEEMMDADHDGKVIRAEFLEMMGKFSACRPRKARWTTHSSTRCTRP